ncbi:MAG TPA: SMC family ATPase [Acidimicrobiia bacterium]|nr:SMC family ATPase [Acidimicrobiia bacterium]
MRLLRLELAGFGAFRSPTELTFDDADFFALVGPTGSGKSTILDAVCFALYGSVPRYESENLIRYVVSLGASEARVRLDFELAGDHYVATRVARRNPKGVVATKEARLERVTGTDTTEVVAGFEREMSAAVVGLLGLRFDDFTRCVALPQGDFARFLRAKGDERRDLLLRLLNLGVYTELGATARRLAAEARSQVGLLDGQLAELDFATPEARTTAQQRQAAVDELCTRVQSAQPILAELLTREGAARSRAEQAGQWAARLEAIEVPAAVRAFAEKHRKAQAAVAEADGILKTRRAEQEAAQQARGELPDAGPLQAARAAHGTLAGCGAKIAATGTLLEEQEAAEAGAQTAVEAADTALREAVAARDAAQRRHLAHALTETLVVGEACPVCDRVVDEIPRREPVAALTDADRAATRAETLHRQAQRAQGEAAKLRAGTAGQLQALQSQREALTNQLESHPDVAVLDDLIARVEGAAQALADAQTKEREALGRAEQAKEALAALDGSYRAARNDFTAQRDTVAGLGPPPADHHDVLLDWEALAAWATALIPTQLQAATEAETEAAGHTKARAETLSGLHDGLQRLGIPAARDADPVSLATTVAVAAQAAAHEVERIDAAITKAADVRATRTRLDEQAEVADLLGKLLRADRFPEWLVAEALAVLTVDASEILRQLTGGQFSLAVGEKEFVVIDHANADEQRPARTLSGGETFQASLALALALSQQIRNLAAEGAPRLDAIFLDEGFGSLDPETLDVVAATIENLGQSGRMVGVVTHVSELAARVPVRFEVRKGLGSSVVEKVFA